MHYGHIGISEEEEEYFNSKIEQHYVNKKVSPLRFLNLNISPLINQGDMFQKLSKSPKPQT